MSFNIVPQPEERRQMKQPTRDWLDLPTELMANILYRIGVFDILLSAQKVCTAWRKICKDPAMWRVVFVDDVSASRVDIRLDEMCKHVVDRSQGQLVDFTIVGCGYGDILLYIANRSSQLKRLTIASCDDELDDIWTESLKKFPLLEELGIYETKFSEEAIETAGRYCPMLKTLKVNQENPGFWGDFSDEEFSTNRDKICIDDEIAMAIGLNLHQLRHLELIQDTMSNEGLEMILDGCPHLESLDLRGCLFINLNGDLGKRCSQLIKCLKLPNDSLKGCPYIYIKDDMTFDDDDEEGFDEEFDYGSYDESEEGSDEESDDESYDESDDGLHNLL